MAAVRVAEVRVGDSSERLLDARQVRVRQLEPPGRRSTAAHLREGGSFPPVPTAWILGSQRREVNRRDPFVSYRDHHRYRTSRSLTANKIELSEKLITTGGETEKEVTDTGRHHGGRCHRHLGCADRSVLTPLCRSSATSGTLSRPTGRCTPSSHNHVRAPVRSYHAAHLRITTRYCAHHRRTPVRFVLSRVPESRPERIRIADGRFGRASISPQTLTVMDMLHR